MNLTEYLTAMKESGSPIAIIGVALLCLFLVVTIIKMLGGMRRGSWRQLFRTGVTLAAAIVAYLAAVIVSNSIMGSSDSQSMQDFINMMDNAIPGIGALMTQVLSTFDNEIFEYIIILPATIVLVPMLATLIFLLINLALKIVRTVLIKIFGFKPTKNNSQRLGGALIGVGEALIWIVMVTLPITGIIGLADSAYERAIESEEGKENASLVSTYNEFIAPFTENPAFLLLDSLGVQSLSDGIATIWIGDEKTNLRDEILEVAKIGMIEIPSLGEADFAALTEQEKIALSNMIESLKKSPFLSSVVAGIIQSSSGFMSSDAIPFDREGVYGSLFTSLTAFLESVNGSSLPKDLDTITQIYFAISDSGIIKTLEGSDGDVMTLLEDMRKMGDDTLVRIISILRENPRAQGMLAAMARVMIYNLSISVDPDNTSSITITYNSLKNAINYVLAIDRTSYSSYSEYMSALRFRLNNAFGANGILLDDDVLGAMAHYVDDNLSNVTIINEREFNELLLYYYDAYLEYNQSNLVSE